jgi:hypothetical protein
VKNGSLKPKHTMPDDLLLPADHIPASAGQMHGQLDELTALVDAIVSTVAAQIDVVNTLDPGDPAAVAVNVTSSTLRFSFGLPAGTDGGEAWAFSVCCKRQRDYGVADFSAGTRTSEP